MAAGRKPKPTHLKLVTGNPGKRRLNKAEPKPRAVMPSCPEHLSDVAKVEWGRVSEELHRLGLLTLVDRAALAAYCQLYARWVDAEDKIKKYGTVIKTAAGNAIQSPYVGMANKCLELMHRYLTEFGMTPSARSRITAADEGAKGDPWEAL